MVSKAVTAKMPILATGLSSNPACIKQAIVNVLASHRRQTRHSLQGFTLLEVLVVILMIGIILGIAVISLPQSSHDQLATEAERLNALITLASQEAVISNRQMALDFTPDGYRFLAQSDKGDWQTLTSGALHPRTLADGLQLDVTLEGLRLQLNQQSKDSAGLIYLLSSGEISPFEVTLETTTEPIQKYRITATIDGQQQLLIDE